MFAVMSDLVLGIVGLQNKSIRSSIDSPLEQGFTPAVVYAACGMCFLALAMLALLYVNWSGVLTLPEWNGPDYDAYMHDPDVSSVLQRSFMPAVLSDAEAAVLTKNADWLVVFAGGQSPRNYEFYFPSAENSSRDVAFVDTGTPDQHTAATPSPAPDARADMNGGSGTGYALPSLSASDVELGFTPDLCAGVGEQTNGAESGFVAPSPYSTKSPVVDYV